MPLKRAVLPLLDHIEPLAAEVGAANTVVFAAGRRHGHNTDVPGLLAALAERGITGTSLPPHPAVLILGAGATARSALAALRALSITQVTVAARDPARASDLLATADRLALKITAHPLRHPPRPPGPADLDRPRQRSRPLRPPHSRAHLPAPRRPRHRLRPLAHPPDHRRPPGRSPRSRRLRPPPAPGRRPVPAHDRLPRPPRPHAHRRPRGARRTWVRPAAGCAKRRQQAALSRHTQTPGQHTPLPPRCGEGPHPTRYRVVAT